MAPRTLPTWGVLVMALGVLTLATLLMLVQRRGGSPSQIGPVPPFPEAAGVLAGQTGGTLLEGNLARILENGAFFDAVVTDVAAATHHVHFETFVWTDSAVADRMGAAFAEASRRGVRVRVLLDAFGAKGASGELLDLMRGAGVRVEKYRPISLAHAHSQNYRDHRKVLVIDGRVAYAMGHGTDDLWDGAGQDPEHWRDTAVRLEGPVVNALQGVFAENWIETTSEVFGEMEYFPAQPLAGTVAAHVAASSSGDAVSNVALLFDLAAAAAREEILLTTPYFAPESELVDGLVEASSSGVRVTLLLPGAVTDSKAVQHAGHRHYRRLLEGGVRIFEHQKTMVHQKVAVVDRAWSHVGSTNLDLRSLQMSEEVSVGLLDPAVAEQLAAQFARDLQDSREVTLDEVREQSPFHTALDWLSDLANEQL